MGLFDGFFGGAQRKDLQDANQRATAYLNDAWKEGSQQVRDWSNQGLGYLNPYMQQGSQGNALYGRFLGLDGADQQRDAMNTYATSDPFRQFNDDNASRALSRRFAAQGMGDSGASRLAMARAGLERGSQDYNSYLDRLRGVGQQGLGAAGASAGIAQQTGNTLGQMRYGMGQQQAGNAISFGNAMAGSRNIGMQNILGLAGAAGNFFGGGRRV
jgi:hypothetical protein